MKSQVHKLQQSIYEIIRDSWGVNKKNKSLWDTAGDIIEYLNSKELLIEVLSKEEWEAHLKENFEKDLAEELIGRK